VQRPSLVLGSVQPQPLTIATPSGAWGMAARPSPAGRSGVLRREHAGAGECRDGGWVAPAFALLRLPGRGDIAVSGVSELSSVAAIGADQVEVAVAGPVGRSRRRSSLHPATRQGLPNRPAGASRGSPGGCSARPSRSRRSPCDPLCRRGFGAPPTTTPLRVRCTHGWSRSDSRFRRR
jgi:hypothetical protein